MTPKGKDAIREQLRFAVEVMNSSQTVQGRTRWSVKEPWVTRFRQLAEDKAFQRIQIRYVRALLDRARQFCEQFSLKSEMSYAFMFDAVSSHGPWWLTKKWKDGTQKRRQLLSERLAALDAKYGKGSVPEREVLLAIADVLAETSSVRWRANVIRRKRWFVTGLHPRSAELRGLNPRANEPYQTSTRAAVKSAQAAEDEVARTATTAVRGPMSDPERSRLVAAAYTRRPPPAHRLIALTSLRRSKPMAPIPKPGSTKWCPMQRFSGSAFERAAGMCREFTVPCSRRCNGPSGHC